MTRPKDVRVPLWLGRLIPIYILSPCADKDKGPPPTFLPSSEPKAHAITLWAGSSFYLCIDFDAVLRLQSNRELWEKIIRSIFFSCSPLYVSYEGKGEQSLASEADIWDGGRSSLLDSLV